MIPRIESDICFVCGKETPRGWIFCENCKPPVGKTAQFMWEFDEPPTVLYNGFYDYLGVRRDYTEGHIIIRWWIGTDALKLNTFPPGRFWWPIRIIIERFIAKKLEPYISEHWVVHECLIPDLLKFGIQESKIRIVEGPADLQRKFPKVPHDGFNILYYAPISKGIGANRKYKRWKYGADIIEKVK